MSMEWWRCKHGAPFDPKWRAVALRAQSRPGDVWAVFTTLCDRASQASERGSIEGVDLEDVAAGLGYDLEEVQRIFVALKARGLVTEERISNWERHQPKRERDNDDSAERVQRHREAKKRQEAPTLNPVTPRNATQRQETPREEKRRVEKKDSDSEGVVSGGGPRASRSTAKPTRWPSEAVVPEDWISEAEAKLAELGRPPLDLRLEAEKFRNYWASKAGGQALKTDWRKTWFTWILSDKNGGKSNGTGRRSTVGETLERLAGEIADAEALRRS